MKTILSFGLAAGVFGLLSVAAAQPAATDSPPAAQGLRYDSAFADYKAWQDLRPAEWRKVNDTVREAAPQGGGHGAHASPAASAPRPASGPSPSPSKPSTTPVPAHGAHGHHGGAK